MIFIWKQIHYAKSTLENFKVYLFGDYLVPEKIFYWKKDFKLQAIQMCTENSLSWLALVKLNFALAQLGVIHFHLIWQLGVQAKKKNEFFKIFKLFDFEKLELDLNST